MLRLTSSDQSALEHADRPPLPCLVPALDLPSPAARPAITARERRPLPLAPLIGGRTQVTVYGVVTVDLHGRLADRVVMRALGWRPGDHVAITLAGSTVKITASPQGRTGSPWRGGCGCPPP